MFPTVPIFGVALEHPRRFAPLFRPLGSAQVQDCACADRDIQTSFICRRKGGVHE